MIGLLLFPAVILLTFFIEFRWKRRRFYQLAKKLPGHEGLSIIESLTLGAKLTRKDYISTVESFFKDNAPITKIWIANFLAIFTKDADFIYKIFNTPQTYDKPKILYQMFFADEGLAALNGDKHKVHRKILDNGFTTRMLQRLPEIFDEKSKKFLLKMQKNANGDEFDVMDYIMAFTYDSFGKSHLNYEIDYFQSEICNATLKFSSTAMDFMPIFGIGLSKNILNYINYKGFKNTLDSLKKFAHDAAAHNKLVKFDETNALINLLTDPKHEFTDQELEDEMHIVGGAASEAMSLLVSISLMMLGIHKNVQQRLFNEIDEIFNQEPQPLLNLDFIQKFTYLEAVVKETLRLFTITPFIAREVTEEVEIDGYLLPKGVTIVISLYSLHRNEKYWGEDAHLFRPERFLEELKNPHAFMPFAGGKRTCIGNRYAMICAKVFLINFIRSYKVECSSKLDEIKTELSMTLSFIDGYKIGIQRR